MILETPIEQLPGTSPITIKKLKLLGVTTYFDLLNIFPSRYENFSLISQIKDVQEGETVTVIGTIEKAENAYTRKGITLQKVTVKDGTGSIEVVWYNQPYLVKTLKSVPYVSVSGTVKKFLHTFSLEPKEYETLYNPTQTTIHTGRIIPIYPEKKGISTKTLRDKVFKVVKQDPTDAVEWIPEDIQKFNNLMPEAEALKLVHFPETLEQVERARERLSFDELFTIQLSAALIRQEWKQETVTKPLHVEQYKKEIDAFISSLPFTLTEAQQRVLTEITGDMASDSPMNRFLQGDVGSGKTVIAGICAYISYLNGAQTLIMAPTEILANQHYNTLTTLCKHLPIKIGLQTGTKKISKKEDTNSYDILVGTHALLNEKLSLSKVGLVVIDEQHRFGVAQRAQLKKKGINPHLLTMTATPIPRTVALTLYGELELSVINEMPKGRLPIKTFLVSKKKRDDAYKWIEKEITEKGVQAFIICPLIEESETETMSSVKAAKKEFEFLQNTVFKNLKVGLLHGKIKGKEKDEIMRGFKEKKYDILVATSVVEVGIDVPNASIMIIEGAERYGLAQLHQLRGRVGRGSLQSYCLLFTSDVEEKQNSRLEFFAKTTSGIDLAEFDFKIRGPGQIFGTQQSGYTDLKIANLSDVNLIDKVKKAVHYFMNHYSVKDYPVVNTKIQNYRIQHVSRD